MDAHGGGLTIRFWGTRGSLPSPGPNTARYGGNTSCVEIRAGDALIVLDAGSGMRELGNRLLPAMPLEAHVFFTHYHWDHIMGLPFFAPLFIPGNVIHLYGETKSDRDVREILSGQMIQPYFPVSMGTECKSDIRSHPISPGDVIALGEARVTCCRLNHPGDAVAYRVDHGGRSVVYATDIEHDADLDASLIDLAEGADALIFDSTYTDAEYAGHVGWGHSTWRAGVEIAKAAGVGQFIIFHHLPERTDQEVAAIERAARRAFAGAVAAREGMEIALPAAAEAAKRNGHRPRAGKKATSTKQAAPKRAAKRKTTGSARPKRKTSRTKRS
jgi:phosphoribosyl 1,2-cyclic phosphodiesterase